MGIHTMRIEAPEGRSLPALLAPQLRQALLRLSRNAQAREFGHRALRALAGFAKALKLKYTDIEVGLDFEPELGLADNGDLEHYLQALLESVGLAAQKAGTALVMFVDELQYVAEDELAALITALHRAAQRQLPVTLVGAGLPQLRGRMGRAKSYAERLFDFPDIGALSPSEASIAISKPLADLHVAADPGALQKIILETQGYPYFLQEWGKHAWDVAQGSPITASDVAIGSSEAIAALDESFFRVRSTGLTGGKTLPACDGGDWSGPASFRRCRSATGTQSQLARADAKSAHIQGKIWSPSHGDTAFTVPLFDEFMRRIMPGDEWKEG